MMSHKAGFVNIIGMPNAGKSTLLNALVGEKLAITTPLAQTTRHRIKGIENGEDYQIIYSDTPGILAPKYKMQEQMLQVIDTSFIDADILLIIIDPNDKKALNDIYIKKISDLKIPKILLVNKMDVCKKEHLLKTIQHWEKVFKLEKSFAISALNNKGITEVHNALFDLLPVHPAFYPKDELTDRPERFFVAEMIREQIFRNCKQEIPYSATVEINAFSEEEKITKIAADIIVNRQSQKPIMIGKNGSMLKKIGTAARKDIEAFLDKKVYLELYVRVNADWRDNEYQLRNLGYNDQ